MKAKAYQPILSPLVQQTESSNGQSHEYLGMRPKAMREATTTPMGWLSGFNLHWHVYTHLEGTKSGQQEPPVLRQELDNNRCVDRNVSTDSESEHAVEEADSSEV